MADAVTQAELDATAAEVKVKEGENKETPTEGGDNKSGDNKLFTQEQLNSILAENKRALQRENKTLMEKLEGQTTEFTEFKNLINQAAEDAGVKFTEDGLVDVEGDGFEGYGDSELEEYQKLMTPPKGVKDKALWQIIQGNRINHSRHLGALTEQLEQTQGQLKQAIDSISEERKVRLEAEIKVREQDRDRMLIEALNDAKCVDTMGGMRYFTPQMKYVEGKGWMYEPRGAKDEFDYIPVKEGIQKEIPSYLVQTSVSAGGSGARGSETGGVSDANLAEMKAVMEQLYEKGQSGDRRAISTYQQAKRNYNDALEKRKMATGR